MKVSLVGLKIPLGMVIPCLTWFQSIWRYCRYCGLGGNLKKYRHSLFWRSRSWSVYHSKLRYFIPTAKLILWKLSESEKYTLSVSTPISVGAWNTKHESLKIADFKDVSHLWTRSSKQILTTSFFSTSCQKSPPNKSRLTLTLRSIGPNCFIISAD